MAKKSRHIHWNYDLGFTLFLDTLWYTNIAIEHDHL